MEYRFSDWLNLREETDKDRRTRMEPRHGTYGVEGDEENPSPYEQDWGIDTEDEDDEVGGEPDQEDLSNRPAYQNNDFTLDTDAIEKQSTMPQQINMAINQTADVIRNFLAGQKYSVNARRTIQKLIKNQILAHQFATTQQEGFNKQPPPKPLPKPQIQQVTMQRVSEEIENLVNLMMQHTKDINKVYKELSIMFTRIIQSRPRQRKVNDQPTLF